MRTGTTKVFSLRSLFAPWDGSRSCDWYTLHESQGRDSIMTDSKNGTIQEAMDSLPLPSEVYKQRKDKKLDDLIDDPPQEDNE